jgi:hypothetical protein
MNAFATGGYDRRNADLKDLRNDLVGLMGSSKPWEVLVGQRLAYLTIAPSNPPPNSITAFLGTEVCTGLLMLPAS